MGEVFTGRDLDMRLLCDFSHNSIFRETVDGSPMWVHRHNACRVVEGQLVFLPGYANTSSYICSGGTGARYFLNTMDHGAGKTIDRLRKKGLVRELDNGRVTRAYNNESSEPKLIPHWSDEGIDEVIASLRHNDIVRPVARLRPVAGYRYLWKGRLARAREKITAG
jgi:RNA-splicing ligase RtcB